MIYRSEDDVEYEAEEAPRRGRRWISVMVVLALAATGCASALLWRAYGNTFPTFPSFMAQRHAADAGDGNVCRRISKPFQQQITAQTRPRPTARIAAGGDQASVRTDDGPRYKIDTLQRSVHRSGYRSDQPAPIPIPPVRKNQWSRSQPRNLQRKRRPHHRR